MLIIDNYRRSQRGRWKDTFAERHSVHFSSTWNFAKKIQWMERNLFHLLVLLCKKFPSAICAKNHCESVLRSIGRFQPTPMQWIAISHIFLLLSEFEKKTLFSWEGPDPFNHIYLQILSFPISNKYIFGSVLKNVTSNSAISKDHVSNHYYDHLFLTSKMF